MKIRLGLLNANRQQTAPGCSGTCTRVLDRGLRCARASIARTCRESIRSVQYSISLRIECALRSASSRRRRSSAAAAGSRRCSPARRTVRSIPCSSARDPQAGRRRPILERASRIETEASLLYRLAASERRAAIALRPDGKSPGLLSSIVPLQVPSSVDSTRAAPADELAIEAAWASILGSAGSAQDQRRAGRALTYPRAESRAEGYRR
jgi:hypothetical protein